MICLYCGKEKDDSEFSAEHAIPQKVGGNIKPVNPFLIRNVCRRCNSISGLFIDGPFIRSWQINNSISTNSLSYAKIEDGPILPNLYLGEIKELKYQDKICEFWLGPSGDSIFHFHRPYPTEESVPPIVGEPPNISDDLIDKGFIFVYVRASNPVWHPTIVRSVKSQFKEAEKYLGNGNPRPEGIFKPIPAELSDLYAQITPMVGKPQIVEGRVGIYFADRFIAKLALAFGYIICGEKFISSNSSVNLRRFIWERNREVRDSLQIPMKNFNYGPDDRPELFSWKGGHSIFIINLRDQLVLYVSFYGSHPFSIRITNDEEDWKDRITNFGIFYLIAPGHQRAIGPLSIFEYIAHTLGTGYQNSEMTKLDAMIAEANTPPPYDVL
ncbi:HNH endonuclease [Leptospira yasudae]|nr:HNH endonuclease [Leptospira yasudae]